MNQREARMAKPDRPPFSAALERLVPLDEAWEKKDQAAEWRKKLEVQRATETKIDSGVKP